VREREVREEAVPRGEVRPEDDLHGADGGDEVAVREADALGRACGAGGVHDAGKGVWAGPAVSESALWLVAAEGAEGVDVDGADGGF
jgi:hypothetical protein